MSANVKIALIIAFATIVWLGSGLVSKGSQAEVGLPASSVTKVSVEHPRESVVFKIYVPEYRLLISSVVSLNPFGPLQLKWTVESGVFRLTKILAVLPPYTKTSVIESRFTIISLG